MLSLKLYKLTNQGGTTRRGEANETKWGENITHTAQGEGGLCTSGVIHAYRSPLLAVLLNPCHANINNPILWECKGANIVEEKADKIGVKTLTTIKRVNLPSIVTEHKVRFAIAVALKVYKNKSFKKWALNWLNNIDRSSAAANAAAYAANAAYADAAYADAAAHAAANAAYAAAYAAANAAYAVYAAANAAYAAVYAAANAADAANTTWSDLDKIAKWAISDKPYKG